MRMHCDTCEGVFVLASPAYWNHLCVFVWQHTQCVQHVHRKDAVAFVVVDVLGARCDHYASVKCKYRTNGQHDTCALRMGTKWHTRTPELDGHSLAESASSGQHCQLHCQLR